MGIVTVEFVVVIMMVIATGTVVVLAEVEVVGTVLLLLVVVATAASALGEGRTSFRADVIVYSSSHVASSFTMSSCGLELRGCAQHLGSMEFRHGLPTGCHA